VVLSGHADVDGTESDSADRAEAKEVDKHVLWPSELASDSSELIGSTLNSTPAKQVQLDGSRAHVHSGPHRLPVTEHHSSTATASDLLSSDSVTLLSGTLQLTV